MEVSRKSREEIVKEYRPWVEKLIPYLEWLEAQQGKKTLNIYNGDQLAEHSITFPVYDGTLMRFVKDAKATGFMNRNYIYTYSRKRIKSATDEHRFIQNATLQDMSSLGDILSYYVLKGMTKAALWSEGVRNGIYLELLNKMVELMTFWDKPLV